jgi:hypothetical protein
LLLLLLLPPLLLSLMLMLMMLILRSRMALSQSLLLPSLRPLFHPLSLLQLR